MRCLHKRAAAEKKLGDLLKDRIVLLQDDIDDNNANLTVARLLYLQFDAPDQPVHLYIDSPGGTVTAGFAIRETIDYLNSPVYTYVIGQAHGIAGVILAHGARGSRYACADARCTLIPVAPGRYPPGYQENLRKTTQLVAAALAEDTGQSESTITHDMESWLTLDPQQAVDYGLIDAVVE